MATKKKPKTPLMRDAVTFDDAQRVIRLYLEALSERANVVFTMDRKGDMTEIKLWDASKTG